MIWTQALILVSLDFPDRSIITKYVINLPLVHIKDPLRTNLNSYFKSLNVTLALTVGKATKEHTPIAEVDKLYRQVVSETIYSVSEYLSIDK